MVLKLANSLQEVRAGRMLYKMKIIAVGRIIYNEYISFFSNDIILSISDYFAKNNKYINMMLKELLFFVFEKNKVYRLAYFTKKQLKTIVGLSKILLFYFFLI